MSNKKTNRTALFNALLQQWIDFFEVQIIALIKLSHRYGASKGEIANAMGIDLAAFSRKYSKHLGVTKK